MLTLTFTALLTLALAEDAILREVRIPYLSQPEMDEQTGTMPDGLLFTRNATAELYVAVDGNPLRINPPQAEWSHLATRTFEIQGKTLAHNARYATTALPDSLNMWVHGALLFRLSGNSETVAVTDMVVDQAAETITLDIDTWQRDLTPTVEYCMDLMADPQVWTEVEDYILSETDSGSDSLITATIVPHQGSPLDFAPFYRISVPGSYVAPLVEIRGNASVTGELSVEEGIAADNMTAGSIAQTPLSADPADPDDLHSVQWVSDGTGSGDAGDVMLKINVGGTVKTITLIDWSAE